MHNNEIVITSFYHFQDLPNYVEIKNPLLEFCTKNNLKGTILLAHEGINSTISGMRDGINNLYEFLTKDLKINIENFKESFSDVRPFQKMKVRLKKEIVAMGILDLEVHKYRGKYIRAKDWASYLDRDDVVVIDTRNNYEIKLGTFKNAINPQTKSFREFPQWFYENRKNLEDKKVLMFCTGGVRCEKSTALLAKEGLDVYHLEGGIIKYLEDTNNTSGAWQGSCFVFDDRVSLDNALASSGDLICRKCSSPLTTDDVRDTNVTAIDICKECNDKERFLV